MRKFVGIFLLMSAWLNVSFGQDFELLPEHKAFLFHTVKKSPLLERHLGRGFIYAGPDIRLPNGNLNLDSIEMLIVEDPARLTLAQVALSKAPAGLLAELSNKTAIWILNSLLHRYRQHALTGVDEMDVQRFMNMFHENLPKNAFHSLQNGELKLYDPVEKMLNPGLNINDKLAMLDGVNILTLRDKYQVLQAWDKAVNNFVQLRTIDVFSSLGGVNIGDFSNRLVAVGDGINMSSAFEDREKNERGRWIIGLPKSTGFFGYQLTVDDHVGANKSKISLQDHAIFQFQTAEPGFATTIHADVWGYNTDKQSTVVIDKGGKQYVLLGNSENRFLSPDSSFKEGITYYGMIRRLQHEVDELERLITGKKGIDHWLAHYEKKKAGKLLQIDKVEKEINDIRMIPITTTTKGKKKKKKLVAESEQRKRHPKQEAFIQYNLELAAIRKKIQDYEKLKEETLHSQQIKIQQIKWMLDLIGNNWISFQQKDGLYIFEDGATFDYKTQAFTLSPTHQPEVFEIRVLAIPALTEDDQTDELMVHLSVFGSPPHYQSPIHVVMIDELGTNTIAVKEPIFDTYDSLTMRLFLEAIIENRNFKTQTIAGGVGYWNGAKTVAMKDPELLSNYEGSSTDAQKQQQLHPDNVRLRTVQIYGSIDRGVGLEINSFTDLVKTSQPVFSSRINKMILKNKWSNNDLLTAYRTTWAFEQCVLELKQIANEMMDPDAAKKIVAILDKSLKNARIDIHGKHVKMTLFRSMDE
jgi:hypothetical protein